MVVLLTDLETFPLVEGFHVFSPTRVQVGGVGWGGVRIERFADTLPFFFVLPAFDIATLNMMSKVRVVSRNRKTCYLLFTVNILQHSTLNISIITFLKWFFAIRFAQSLKKWNRVGFE